jgi:hypothetical protein
MAIGKNAKKRAARRAFHDTPCDGKPGAMPYSFKVVEYRRADDMAISQGKAFGGGGMVRRVLTFASLTSYKEYRERFFSTNPAGTLSLVNPLSDSDVNATRGESFRQKVINQGNDTSKARAKPLLKGISVYHGIKGKPFDKPASGYDALQSMERDKERLTQEETRRLSTLELQSIRQRYRKV